MKRLLAITLSILMLLSVSIVAILAALPEGVEFSAGQYGSGNAEDFSAVGDKTITWDPDFSQKVDLTDGDVADWVSADYERIAIDASNMISWVGDSFSAPMGFAMDISFVADSEWLYIGVSIVDPFFAYGSAGADYSGDAFQLCIDFGGRLGDLLEAGTRLENCKNIFYSFSAMGDGAPIVISRQESANNATLTEANGDGVKGTTKKTENGWSAEFALSWEMLYTDYSDKAAIENDEITVGGDDNLPLKVGCCVYYLDRSTTGGAFNWAAGTTGGLVNDAGEPCLSWTAYDNGINLSLPYEEGMTFDCEGIVVLDKTADTEPDTDPETDPETELETDPETNPETDLETDPETDLETDPETTPETDLETDPETNLETTPETDPETEPAPAEPKPAFPTGAIVGIVVGAVAVVGVGAFLILKKKK